MGEGFQGLVFPAELDEIDEGARGSPEKLNEVLAMLREIAELAEILATLREIAELALPTRELAA
jgi:hypothetical protein